jgi:hypothetical protein
MESRDDGSALNRALRLLAGALLSALRSTNLLHQNGAAMEASAILLVSIIDEI